MSIICNYKLDAYLLTFSILHLTLGKHEGSSEHEEGSVNVDEEGDSPDNNSNDSIDYEKLLSRTLSDAKEQGISVLDKENIEMETDIDKVCERLRTIDVLLTKIFQDPPAKGGDDLMELVRIYNQACQDLLFLCTKDKLKVLDMAQDILEPGGPKFFDIDIDKNKLKEQFNWDENKIDDMENVTKKTYSHWNQLDFINNNFNADRR